MQPIQMQAPGYKHCIFYVCQVICLLALLLTGPDMFHTLPLLEDQQLGAILMKIIQEIVYGSILAVVVFDWARKERAKDAVPDALIPKYEKSTARWLWI